ncbi:MAG: HAD hydrolase-like protein, partial [Deltaproteobacteria bacterium]|nr:HAD hydrolase-like protein [Deltaproteobacteria bacterium]
MNTGRTGMRPQAVLFDLDGTLSDSFADITTAINLTRADFGLVPVTLSEVRSRVGSGSAQLVRDMVPVPEEQFEQACTVYRAHYEAHLLDETHLYPGVTETLEHFGDRPLAVITNKGQAFSERILAGLGILDRFRMVL